MPEKVFVNAKAQEAKQKCSNSCNQKPGFKFSGSSADRILQLQRTAGNQAVQRLIKSGTLQSKLKISQPNDIYEQEADRVAEQVMRIPEPIMQRQSLRVTPLIQRQVSEEKEEILQAKDVAGQSTTITPSIESSISELQGGGQSLDPATRAFFEPRFGQDLSRIRIHTDTRAANSAKSIGARAYTINQNIIFGTGEFNLSTQTGINLFTHELLHTLQNVATNHKTEGIKSKSRQDDPSEIQARNITDRMAKGEYNFIQSLHFSTPLAPVQAMNIAPYGEPDSYLPNVKDLKSKMSVLMPSQRIAFIMPILDEVKKNYNKAKLTGLITILEKVRTEERKMRNSKNKPIPGLDESTSRPKAFRERLMIDADHTNRNIERDTETKLGLQLVLGIKTVELISNTPDNIVSAIMSLRRLNDVLIRVLSSQDAAQATGTPLSSVLSMYRVEGDMNVPPSYDSIIKEIPPSIIDARTHLNPTPEISRLVWLADSDKLNNLTDEQIKEFALVEWFIQIGGLDQVGKLNSPRRISFTVWSTNNWLKATSAVEGSSQAESERRQKVRDEATKRWDDLINNMMLDRVNYAVRVMPKDPRLLISNILKEAIMLQRAYARADSLLNNPYFNVAKVSSDLIPAMSYQDIQKSIEVNKKYQSSDLTPAMSYLHFHAGQDNTKHILIKALIAASTTSGNRYRKLRIAEALLNINDLKNKSKDTNSQEAWNIVSSWLEADSKRIQLLSDFIETAGTDIWNTSKEHRGNLSRYKLLFEYYTRLTE